MKVYVASKSSNARFALQPDSVIEVIFSGPHPLNDAKSYAREHVEATDENAYVFEVEVKPVGSYKVRKEVVFVAPIT